MNGSDREMLLRDLVEGQYNYPICIVAFNTAEGWSRDVTVDIADELRRRHVEFDEVSESLLEFIEANRHSEPFCLRSWAPFGYLLKRCIVMKA